MSIERIFFVTSTYISTFLIFLYFWLNEQVFELNYTYIIAQKTGFVKEYYSRK